MRGKNFQIYGVHIPRKCIESWHSKLDPKFFLSSHLRQKQNTHSPGQRFFENLFLPTAEGGGGNYDLLYQNSIRKHEVNKEH